MHSLGDGSDDLFSIVASKGALDLNDKKKKMNVTPAERDSGVGF